MPTKAINPRPLFPGIEAIGLSSQLYFSSRPCVSRYLDSFPSEIGVENDFQWGQRFLSRFIDTPSTFANYRTVIERLLLWSWIDLGKSALALNRGEFGQFLSFCKKPPFNWVSATPGVRFLEEDDAWVFNGDWRPFSSQGQADPDLYQPITSTLRQIQSICSSFYNFLHAEDATALNPTALPRSRTARREKSDHPPRHVLSVEQLSRVLAMLELRADRDNAEERTLFLVAATAFLCLGATDLAKSRSYYPTFNSFEFEGGEWWLSLGRPGVPPHRVPVSVDFLPYLERYRKSRGLQALPEPGEDLPMLETSHGRPGLSARQINEIVCAALKAVHSELVVTGEQGAEWNVLLGSPLRLLKYSGARKDAKKISPEELKRNLRSSSISYTYGRFYS